MPRTDAIDGPEEDLEDRNKKRERYLLQAAAGLS